MAEPSTFEGWAILELMGHRRLTGYVSEVELAGAKFLRLDVPKNPWVDGCTCGSENPSALEHTDHDHTCQQYRDPASDAPLDISATQFYSPAAVYCLTPTTEELARRARKRPTPVAVYELEPPRPRPTVDVVEARPFVDLGETSPDEEEAPAVGASPDLDSDDIPF